jgi:hypothetical protein
MFHFSLVPQLKWLLRELAMPPSNLGVTSGTDERGLPDACCPVVAERGVLGASTFAATKQRHQVRSFLVRSRSISKAASLVQHGETCRWICFTFNAVIFQKGAATTRAFTPVFDGLRAAPTGNDLPGRADQRD